MPKSFSVRSEYGAAPDAAYAASTDADTVVAKLTALGAYDVEVVERSETADGVRLEIRRKQDIDVPSFAKKVVKPTNSITLVEQWARDADGSATADWHAEISPARVTISGTRRITVSGAGSTETIDGQATASVPIIGGKLAEFVATETEKALAGEQDWLSKHLTNN